MKRVMRIRVLLCVLSIASACVSGCAPLVIGGAAVTAGAGTYIFINGELKSDYPYSFEDVWNACERVVADMKAVEVAPSKEIGNGVIDALIEGEKVHFTVTYKAKNLTSLAIRVGVLGDKLASQRLHDKVAEALRL